MLFKLLLSSFVLIYFNLKPGTKRSIFSHEYFGSYHECRVNAIILFDCFAGHG